MAHHPDNDGWYDPKKTQCHACAARERAVQGNGKDPYKPQPGEKVHTVYNRPASKPLPGLPVTAHEHHNHGDQQAHGGHQN